MACNCRLLHASITARFDARFDHIGPYPFSPPHFTRPGVPGVNSTEVSAEAVAEEVSVFAEAVAEEVGRPTPVSAGLGRGVGVVWEPTAMP